MDHITIALNALLNGDKETIAKKHISQLSSEQKLTILDTLSLEQQQTLLFATISQLVSNVNFGETVASLFGQSLPRYIYNHIGTVIPYVLQLPFNTETTMITLPAIFNSAELMDAVATALFMSTRTLYQDYGYLAIVHCLLLDPSSIDLSQRLSLLDEVFSAARPHLSLSDIPNNSNNSIDQVPKQLLMGHFNRVTAILSMELWHPDHQFVLDGLEMIKRWANYENFPLIYHLRACMLNIVSHINQILSQLSSKNHQALASLITVLDTLGQEASSFIPQLLGIAQIAMENTANMKHEYYVDACCRLWNRLLSLSGQEQSARHFGDVVRGIVYSLPLCPCKARIADELTQAIKSRALDDTSGNSNFVLDHIPELPPYPELDSLWQWIDEERNSNDELSIQAHSQMSIDEEDQHKQQQRHESELAQLIIHMSMNEMMPSFHSLQKLHRCLSEHQDLLYQSNEVVWPLLGELYDVLLRIIKQHAYRHDISGLAASCLGMLGAVDPSRLLPFEERQELMVKIKKKYRMDNKNNSNNNSSSNSSNSNSNSNSDDNNNYDLNNNNSMRYTNDMIVLENYRDRSENQTFAIHLIVHYLLPTFYSVNSTTNSDNDPSLSSSSSHISSTLSMSTTFPTSITGSSGDMIQTTSQYAIQELLKAVGIDHDRVRGDDPPIATGTATITTTTTGRQRHRLSRTTLDDDEDVEDARATWRLWHSLDPMIQDVMAPLLFSKFEANVQVASPAPPFFELAANSFDTWTRHICFFLWEKVRATASADTSRQMYRIFQACIPSVKAGHVVLTQHLIPFLVLRLLLSSPTPTLDRKILLDEIVGVLNHGTANSDMKQSTLQLIVSITGHCRKWIRQKLQQKKRKTSTNSSSNSISTNTQEDSSVTSIKQFLAQIPHHLMARAAFRTGNYPQALMHYELAIREESNLKARSRRNGGTQATTITRPPGTPSAQEYLDDLCQTYMHLEGTEAMADVLAKSNRNWSRPLEILRFESRGEWNHAKLAYEDLLPEDPSLTPRYFHCLRQLGDYDRIINYAGFILDHVDLDEGGDHMLGMVKQVNRYRAEAAWKSSNWPLLHECIHLPMDDSFDASLAYVLAHMQKNQPLAVYLDINHATIALINSISQSNTESYQQSYDAVLRLQLLNDLESIMMLQPPPPSITTTTRDTMSLTTTPNNDNSISKNDTADPLHIWKIRFSMLKPSYQAQRQLLDLRLAAQFNIWKNNDPNSDPVMTDTERDLRLLLAKTARKAKDMGMALQATYGANHPATTNNDPLALTELAKWYYARSELKLAMQYLQHPSMSTHIKAQFLQTQILGTQYLARKPPTQSNDRAHWNRFNTDIKRVDNSYENLRRRCPDWEKLYCASGAWEEQCCDSSETDYKFFRKAARAVNLYCDALKIGCRYYYSTMPRLLSLWLQIVDSMRDLNDGKIRADAKMSEAIKNAYESANRSILESIDQIPSYLFALKLPRLVSRLAIQDDHVARILAKIVLNVLITYPRTTIWALQFALNSHDNQLKTIANEILQQAQMLNRDPLLGKIFTQMHQFTRYLELVSKEKCSNQSWVKLGSGPLARYTGLLQMKNLELCIPRERSLIPCLPESLLFTPSTSTAARHHPYPLDMPTIASVLPSIQVMSSLQRPKRLSFRGSDGKTYAFLCKQNDDLRKDARMMEFSHMINQFLTKDATSRQQQLYIRTYAVIPLSNRWGLIEWIDNLNPLKSIVRDRWATDGPGAQQYEAIRQKMKQMEALSVDEKVTTFVHGVMPASPPVFYRWFLDNFPEPSEWYASRSRYIRTLAVMSITGYVLGLGDRHADNVMFDATNGDTVHVDLNLIFDQGQELTVPEIVPFRLTRNLIDAMGVPKEQGLFKRSCITTLNMIRDYRPQLLSVFEIFLHDPISDNRKRYSGMTREQAARKEISIISNKIHLKPSAQAQIEYLIKEASSDRNLSQMYSGWMPHI